MFRLCQRTCWVTSWWIRQHPAETHQATNHLAQWRVSGHCRPQHIPYFHLITQSQCLHRLDMTYLDRMTYSILILGPSDHSRFLSSENVGSRLCCWGCQRPRSDSTGCYAVWRSLQTGGTSISPKPPIPSRKCWYFLFHQNKYWLAIQDIYEFIQRRSDWKKIEKTVDKTMYNLSFKEDCVICWVPWWLEVLSRYVHE